MRKLLIVAASLTALTTATATHANEEDEQRPIILESPLALTARLADYLTSCRGKAKPEIEKVSQRIIDRIGNQKWREAMLRFHVERDEPTRKKFCSDTREELDDLLEPDYLPDETPPPGDLDLTPV